MTRPSADVTWGGGREENPGPGCPWLLARVVFVVALVLGLVGCSANDADDGSAGRISWVQLPDGREVLCVAWKSGYAGGLSCDWDNARGAP
jgi:hypothetical protein